MPRVELAFLTSPEHDLTLVEKYHIATQYSECWFDDLELCVVAPPDMRLPFYPEYTHTEIKMPGKPYSVYLIHHA